MKKSLITLSTLSALLLSVGVAQAEAPTAELKVVGELGVPTCTVSATDDGIYNIGKQSPPAGGIILPPMTKTWTISCDAVTFMNFTPVDNRTDSRSYVSEISFGLGMVNGTGKIGYFSAIASNPKVDGVTSRMFTSAVSDFTSNASTALTNGKRTGWSNTTNNGQFSGKVFVTDITVTPVMASSAIMNGAINDSTDIDGSVTLVFAYGI